MSEQPQFESERNYQSFLEEQWIEDVEALMMERGQKYFELLVESLANLLGADRVFIASYDLELQYGTTIADYDDGELIDNYDFFVPGTFNEEVGSGHSILVDDEVRSRFKNDDSLRSYRAVIARPALDENESVIGVICVQFRNPARYIDAQNSIIDCCMGRIGAEMMSFYKTRQLNDMNHQLLRELALSNQLKEELSRLAYVDRVTGLPNREQFLVDLKMFDDMTHHWMAMIGVDCFKPINESMGLEAGDQLLRGIGQRLSELSIPDARVYKWTGDEFLFLTYANSMRDVEDQVKLCDEVFQGSFDLIGTPVKVSRSTGLTNLKDHDSIDRALKSVSMALQKAKLRGGNRAVFWDTSMDTDDGQFFRVHLLMQEGIARHQFVPYYQPIYDPKSESFVGYEALMRWMDSNDKPVFFPNQFIPIAERSGLIVELGKKMIATAVANLQEWNRNFGVSRDLSINLSPLQFHDDDLVRDIYNIINRYQVDPTLIKFEITETLFVHEGEYVLQKLKELKSIGFQLSLDDFGTGYSSLAYLQNYPFDQIKIDKCFVDDVVGSSKSKALIKAVRILGSDLGMNLVAEGVETEEQAECLDMMGVDLLQGYFFSKPMPSHKVELTYTREWQTALEQNDLRMMAR